MNPKKCKFHMDTMEYLRFILSPKGLPNLKKAFKSAPVLAHWAPDLLMMVEMDASDGAITGILSVTMGDGEIRPVAFYSCTLQSTEWNYDTHDKELLAIFEAFKSWQPFWRVQLQPLTC